jgi:hypothetical protein
MISDLELALAAQATYHNPPSFPPPEGSDVWCRVTLGSDGVTKLVAIRGSVTPIDWFRDFLFMPLVSRDHPEMGRCHAGFLNGVLVIVDQIHNLIGSSPYAISAHSLGGGEGVGLAGILILRKRPPVRVLTCGAPRFGMQKFVELLRPYDVKQLRRGNDPVPTVPWDIPPLLEFLDTTIQTPIGKPQLIATNCHSIDGYVADIAELSK